jgi:two-component sensor histidine kinase
MARDLSDYTFVFEVIKNNTTIPVIVTDDKGNVTLSKNLDSLKSKDPAYLLAQKDSMQKQHDPIAIDIYKGKKNYLYYSDSRLFSELRTVFDGLIRSFITEVAVNSASVPVIYTDSTKKNVIAYGKLDSVKIKDPVFVEQTIANMAAHNTPIEIDIGEGWKNYIFYEESFLLTQLKYYPYVQFAVIGLFLLISYTLFSTSRRAEQNQVWVGMAKETAHQLGTPLSSLIAWIEVLKMKNVDEQTLAEMRQDLGRLETITERFSKIGSLPVLEKKNVEEVLNSAVDYIRTRTSKNVSITVKSYANYAIQAGLNVPLFNWVIENICKNAVDAMDGKGSISIEISDLAQYVYIDITDTGKGIPKSKFKTVFEPGYTTKERGWGLGLSLVKRIIENYHSGKIFVKQSEPGKGTTFRIVLNK